MSSEWVRVKVEDACELIVDCVNKTAPTVDHKTPYRMIRTSHIKNGRICLTDDKFVSRETYEKWIRRAKLEVGDVLLTREAPLGSVGMIREEDTLFLGQRIVQYRANREALDPDFLLYSFLAPDLQAQFHSYGGTGSTVDHIRVPDCVRFEISLPPLCEQKAIAHILGTLDDKIELNRKTNETLEAMAKALFKSWFVDFDPVRANAEGRPTGLPAEISDLFPHSFEDSELGEFPSGWKIGAVRNLIEKTGMGPFGSRMKTETFKKKGIPIIKGGNLKGMLVEGVGPDFLSEDHAAELESSCVGEGDIVLTHRGTLGQVSMVPIGSKVKKYVASQSQFYLRPSSIPEGIFLLYFFRSPQGLNRLLANSSGVGVPSLARPSTLTPEIEITIPPTPLLEVFSKQVLALQKSFLSRQDQQQTLSALRDDALLPKLISGEIRIPDAEKMLEEVGV